MRIAILGAGISGTTLARLLAADGHAVVVLEAGDRAGGLCKSRVVNGFTFDEAGGHILFSKQREVLDWQIERCGGKDGVVRSVRNTKIRWHDRWVPYPFENGVGHLPADAIVECMEGYLEAHVQRRLGVDCPATFREWILWRMGEGFARHFMFPYNEKIWNSDLTTMSSEWVAGRVPEAPIADILRAALGQRTEGYAHQAIFYFPTRGGFETLVRGTVEGGDFELRLRTPAERVVRTGERFRVNDEEFDLVVNTVPLPLIEPAFADLPEDIRAAIRALQPISLVNVLFGVELDGPMPDHSWVYLPFAEQGPANRVTYFSNYAPGNAPVGHGSYMAEVTHRGDLHPTRDWILELQRALGRAGILDPDRIVVTDIAESRFAYIDYDLGFAARIARVRDWFDTSGYITFGRFGRYEYHNSDQCIARAMQMHAHIREIGTTGAPARPVFA